VMAGEPVRRWRGLGICEGGSSMMHIILSAQPTQTWAICPQRTLTGLMTSGYQGEPFDSFRASRLLPGYTVQQKARGVLYW
jgi:hypothetical protein